MKIPKRLEKIANKLYELELENQKDNNISQNLETMSSLIKGLSFEDLMLIDGYLEKKLTK